MTQTIYDVAGGTRAFLNLAHAWHARCLADPVVSHAFSHGYHPAHTERLAAYWIEALGGPAEYSRGLGSESGVVRMHSENGEHREMDERALTCFTQALEDAGLPDDPQLKSTLRDYFAWAIENLAAYPGAADQVPEGLAVLRWSWDGPV